MKRILHAIAWFGLILASGILHRADAQTSKRDDKLYRETAAEIRQAVWAMDLPRFKDYTVPAQYKKTGSVVLARYSDLSAGSMRGPRGNSRITLITRELVLLNDAASVKARSELSYTQLFKEEGYYGVDNKVSKFIGARVIKPGGKITELKEDENVLTSDNKEERSAKIAITDLEPGDMLDCYVAVEYDIALDQVTLLPLTFPFYDDVPVLHADVHCSIGKKFAVEYRCFNGAPEFKCAVDAEGNNQLDIATDSLMLVPVGTPWVSPMRQFPVIQLSVVKGDLAPYTSFTRRKPGEVFKNQLATRIIKDATIDLNWAKKEMRAYCYRSVGKKSKAVSAYFDQLTQGGATLHEDSATAELYYMFRFDYLFNHVGNSAIEPIINRGTERLNSFFFSYLLSEYFKYHGLASEVVLATSWYGPRMSEVLNKRDFRYLCNVNEKHDRLLGMSGFYSPAFFVPAELEGITDAVAVDTKNTDSYLANKYTQREIRTPYTGPEDNLRVENLTIMPDPENSGLRIARVTSLNGHFKDSIQRKLLLMEDFYNYERAYFGDSRSLAERMTTEETTRKIADELDAAFTGARKRQREDFLVEAKEWLDAEVTDMNNANVVNPGIRHTAPAFEYASAFRLNGILKRGGSNYLVEVGKLIGRQARTAEARRARTLDVYMPFANTVRTNMTIRIPEGYMVEGLAELGKSITNSTGHFTATAVIEGSIVRITVETEFASARYPAKDWPSLLAIMDAADEWTSAKLLFRKKEEKT